LSLYLLSYRHEEEVLVR